MISVPVSQLCPMRMISIFDGAPTSCGRASITAQRVRDVYMKVFMLLLEGPGESARSYL